MEEMSCLVGQDAGSCRIEAADLRATHGQGFIVATESVATSLMEFLAALVEQTALAQAAAVERRPINCRLCTLQGQSLIVSDPQLYKYNVTVICL